MEKGKITLLEKVMECIEQDEKIFNKTYYGKGIYKISNEMKEIINNSFELLCADSYKIYSSLFEKKEYDYYKDREMLTEGPIQYIVYNSDEYPKGFVHKIDVRGHGIAYSMEPNRDNIIVNGYYTYPYVNKIDDMIVDTVGFMRYAIRYGKDGSIKNITADFKATDKVRGSEIILNDRGYKQFEFDNMKEFIMFRDNLDNYRYAMYLFKDEVLEKANNSDKNDFDDTIQINDDFGRKK